MEEQLTMFNEVRHPWLKDLKCNHCGSKDLEINTAGKIDHFSIGKGSISGCYFCKVCKYGESFMAVGK